MNNEITHAEFKTITDRYNQLLEIETTPDEAVDNFFYYWRRGFEVGTVTVQFGSFGTGLETEMQVSFENNEISGGFGMINIKELVFNLHENKYIRLFASWKLEHSGGSYNGWTEVSIAPSGNYGVLTDCIEKLEKMFNV